MEKTDLYTLFKSSKSFEQLQINLHKSSLYVKDFVQNYYFSKDLGKGAHDDVIVQLYNQKEGDKKYAVKNFKYNILQDIQDADDFITEALTLEKIKKQILSPNIINTRGIFSSTQGNQISLNIILDYADDIKPENLLYKQDFNYYTSFLGDFGEASKNLKQQNTRMTSVRGTPKYLSPELFYSYYIQNQVQYEYNPYKSDLYSLGLTILSIATTNNFFKRSSNQNSFDELVNPLEYNSEDIGDEKWFYVIEIEKLFQQFRDKYNEKQLEDFINILKLSLIYNPKLRFSTSYILEQVQNKFQLDIQNQLDIGKQQEEQQTIKKTALKEKEYDIIESFDEKTKLEIQEIPKIKNIKVQEVLNKMGAFNYGEKSNFKDYSQFKISEFENNSYYQGELNNGQREGIGRMQWQDDQIYEGYWKQNQAFGKGRFINTDGSYYEGDWKDDVMDGNGKYMFADGSNYIGEWCNGKYHGKGIETFSDGSRYEGQFKNGQKDGQGNISFKDDGSSYYGEFSNNQIEGHGLYRWQDGRKYRGLWKNNKMHGYGEFTWPDGRKYLGNYVQDVKEGQGVIKWPDGTSYEGNWKDGKQHGKGILKDKQGIMRKGEWLHGKKI